MITLDLRIQDSELTITSIKELNDFQKSEDKSIVSGTITFDDIKHNAYSLAEVLWTIGSLNIGTLSELISIEVDFDNSSNEFQEIILNAVVEIEDLEDSSQLNVESRDGYSYLINGTIYALYYAHNTLTVLNIDMHDRAIYHDELEYEDKCSKEFILTDSQKNGMSFKLKEELLRKFNWNPEKKSQDIDLPNSHENIQKIAFDLVRKIEDLDAKVDINFMPNNPSLLTVDNNSYSVYLYNSTLSVMKEGTSLDDCLDSIGHAELLLSDEQIIQCCPEDLEYADIDPYVVNLEDIDLSS
jgi:hypothetical protein